MRLAHSPPPPVELGFRALVEHLSDAVVLFTPGTPARYVNPAITALLGYPRDDSLPGNPFGLVYGEDRERLLQVILALVRQPEVPAAAHLRLRHRDGTWRWVECVGTNLLAEPAVRALVLTYRDLGARAQAAAAASVPFAVAGQDSGSVPEAIVAAISHDLKSPLTVIKGHAQLLRRRAHQLDTTDAEPLTKGLSSIDAAATKMLALVQELLDVSQLESGHPLLLDRQPTDLVALTRQEVAEHQGTRGGMRLVLETELATLVGSWDALRLERVLDNLLGNAVKYSPAGGAIAVRVAREGEVAVVTVRDHGVGIPGSDLPRIFERFHRGANVATRIAGTGIGLAGARQIVEQHGGTIAVVSTEGAGTTVTVRLPL